MSEHRSPTARPEQGCGTAGRPCAGGKSDNDNKSDYDKDHKKDKHDPSAGLLLLPLTAAGSVLGAARPTGLLRRVGSSLRRRRRGR